MPRLFQSLAAKLSIAFAIVFAGVGLIYVMVMGHMSDRFQQEVVQQLNRDLARQIVADHLLLKNGRIERHALAEIFHTMMVINPRVELYLLDPAGHLLAYSAPEEKIKRRVVDTAPIRAFLQTRGSGLPLLGDDPRHWQRRKIFSAAPVIHEGVVQGYLYIILVGEAYQSVAQMLQDSYVLRHGSVIILGGLLFTLIAAIWVFMLLTRRLRRLSAAMDRFQESGDPPALLTARKSVKYDEVDILETTFQEMAQRIAAQVEKLRQTDEQRRELVANVSHDLRTPLASLQGYLETLRLKEDALSDRDKRHYLDVALRHGNHLSRLVDELFELAKLEANEVKLQCEFFSLPELVQDVVQKFQLKAEEQGITLGFQFDARTIPYVKGDIGLIERVLDNLLGNALRHTPCGGAVTLVLTLQGDRVTVRISDTGPGIAEQELPHIFERFYKTADGAAYDTGRAGLGLAIAKRILELHGSAIQAISQLDIGTAFIFDLPAGPRH